MPFVVRVVGVASASIPMEPVACGRALFSVEKKPALHRWAVVPAFWETLHGVVCASIPMERTLGG